jgi:hypothetical protein
MHACTGGFPYKRVHQPRTFANYVTVDGSNSMNLEPSSMGLVPVEGVTEKAAPFTGGVN